MKLKWKDEYNVGIRAVDEQHRNEHAQFIDNVSDYQKRLASGEIVFSSSIIHFLTQWLFDHILSSDMEMAVFLLKHGKY